MPGINPLVATPPHAAIDTACPRGIQIKGTFKYINIAQALVNLIYQVVTEITQSPANV